MPFTFSYLVAMIENAAMQQSIIAPPISHAQIPMTILPSVFCRIVCALKKTPEPTTIPTTMQIAVSNPYFLLRPFSMFVLLYLIDYAS